MAQPASTTAKIATAPIAFMALAQHIADNKLLVPHTITFPTRGDDKVTLFLDDFGSQRWVDSIQIDSEANEPRSPGYYRTTIDGRITCPLGAIKVTLRFVRQAPLQVVQS